MNLRSIILPMMCALPFAMAGDLKLGFTNEQVLVSATSHQTSQIELRGKLVLPAEGMLFQPADSPSAIPDQASLTYGRWVLREMIVPYLSHAVQDLPQSSAANGCAIKAQLINYWPQFKTSPEFLLRVLVEGNPGSGELQLKEDLPFILAKGIQQGEPHPLSDAQISQLPEGKSSYRIALGISPDDTVYGYQFYDEKGTLLSSRIRKTKLNTAGQIELECEFLQGCPKSFCTVSLQEPQAVTLPLDATLTLPTQQELTAVDESLGTDSPYTFRLQHFHVFWKPQFITHNLSVSWVLSGFKNDILTLGTGSQSGDKVLEETSHLNGTEARLQQTPVGTNAKLQFFRLLMYQNLCAQQLQLKEDLQLQEIQQRAFSPRLALDADKAIHHTLKGNEYSAEPHTIHYPSGASRDGYLIKGGRRSKNQREIYFYNAEGKQVFQTLIQQGGELDGVFYGFSAGLPSFFQVEFLASTQELSIPCAFKLPMPQWHNHQTLPPYASLEWIGYYQHWGVGAERSYHSCNLQVPTHFHLTTLRDGSVNTGRGLLAFPTLSWTEFDSNSYTIHYPEATQDEEKGNKVAFFTAWSKSPIMPLVLKEDKNYYKDSYTRVDYKQTEPSQAHTPVPCVGELVVSSPEGSPTKELFRIEFLDSEKNLIQSGLPTAWHVMKGEETTLHYPIPAENPPAFFRLVWAEDRTEISIPAPPPTTAASLNSPITVKDEEGIIKVSAASLSYMKDDSSSLNIQLHLAEGWELIADEQPQQVGEGITVQCRSITVAASTKELKYICINFKEQAQEGRLIINEPLTLKLRHEGEEQECRATLSLDITLPVITEQTEP